MKKAENLIQQQSVIWFRNNYCLAHHSPRCVIFSVPNESEDGREAQRKVNMGLMRGVSDCVILLPGTVALFMECKTETGRQSPAQVTFEHTITQLGFNYHIYRSLEQFQQITNTYLKEAGING